MRPQNRAESRAQAAAHRQPLPRAGDLAYPSATIVLGMYFAGIKRPVSHVASPPQGLTLA